MKFRIFKTKEEAEQYVAGEFAKSIENNDVLGLATGGTVVGVYEKLVAQLQEAKTDVSQLRTVNLDEYIGLDKYDINSYYTFMKENLFAKIGLKEEQSHLPSSQATDFAAECEAYEAHIAKLGGVDLQLLGIGENGHIGFNEPGTPFTQRTHVVELEPSTREANARFFNSLEEVPTHAITMGIQTIIEAKRIILVAFGEKKQEIIGKLHSAAVDVNLPASILKNHADVEIVLDEVAAAQILHVFEQEVAQ